MSSVIISREQVQNLQVGDILPNCFGQMKEVVSIHHKGLDVNGKFFACFYQQFGSSSTMSNSIKEGEKMIYVK
jgi:hypothetical protein